MAAAAATATATEAVHYQQQQQQPALFRVVDTALVAPAGPALPPRSIPLTFFDVKWLHLPPVERVLLYRLSPDADVPAILSALRDSLSQALRAFYPMAGHVRMPEPEPEPEGRRRHELSYRPGDAVPFTTAEYGVDIDHLIADNVQVAALAPLVPRLPKGRAVLAVQATLLLGALAVGVTVHHTTCDGAGSTHFLHTWAAAAAAAAAGADDRRRQLPPPPVIDRELIPDPRGLYDMYLRSMPPVVSQDDFEFVLGKHQDPGEDKALATPEQLLQSIKSAVASEAARRGMVTPPRCSSILATYGFIWSCYLQIGRRAATAKRKSYFLFSVDQRSRLKPPVPDKYFGNCCCPAIATAPTDEVAAGGIVGLFAACAAVAAAVEEEVREGAQERWDACVARVKEAVANGTLSVRWRGPRGSASTTSTLAWGWAGRPRWTWCRWPRPAPSPWRTRVAASAAAWRWASLCRRPRGMKSVFFFVMKSVFFFLIDRHADISGPLFVRHFRTLCSAGDDIQVSLNLSRSSLPQSSQIKAKFRP